MKKIVLLFVIVVFSTSRCSLIEGACDLLPKADVLFDVMSLADDVVGIGVPIGLSSTVKNALDSVCDKVESTGAHFTGYTTLFSTNSNTGFMEMSFMVDGQTLDNLPVATPSLEGGTNQPINISFEVNEEGFYMLMGGADSQKDVDERDEDNNGRESDTVNYGGKSSTSRTYNRSDFDHLVEGKDYVFFQAVNLSGKPISSNTDRPTIKLLGYELK